MKEHFRDFLEIKIAMTEKLPNILQNDIHK
jgi:hypothetical protein